MTEFVPYGSQYYRAPTPPAEDWERDLRGMAERGFNSVKFWVQWRWNHPEPGEFDFSDIDRLMDISAQAGLKVFLNIIYDVAPDWLFTQHPDCRMVDVHGLLIEPSTSPCRQIGGSPGPCYHHPQALEARKAFTRAAVARYRHHPAMAVWDVWNEPELCFPVRKPEVDKLVCYCANCREAFLMWLTEKYGSIQSLNSAWGKNYRSFERVELPRDPRAFKDMIDWREFFRHTLLEELRWRSRMTKDLDALHPVMTHTVFGFNKINGCDDYQMAKEVDWFGGSTNAEAHVCASYPSFSPGKRNIAAEIHANGGNTVNRGAIKSFLDYKTLVLTPLAAGHSGFLYWQYRCELLGLEAPMWGLTRPDGTDAPQMAYAMRIGKAFRQVQRLILHGQRPRARVGVLFSAQSQVFNWCADYDTNTYDTSVRGAFDLFYKAGLLVDLVDTAMAREDKLGQYKVLYHPMPYYLDAPTARCLKEWVADGGVLISEACFGGYSDTSGRHAERVPGFGMDVVFGMQVGEATSTTRFLHSYDDFAGIDKSRRHFALLDWGQKQVQGDVFIEELCPAGARVLASYANSALKGRPAATAHAYGKGQAIYLGTLTACVDANQEDGVLAGLLIDIVGEDLRQGIRASAGSRCDTISLDDEVLLVVRNLKDKAMTATLDGFDCRVSGVADLLDEEAPSFDAQRVHVALEPQEQKLLLVRLV